MDGHRFDELTRALARGTSRRAVLRGLGAGLLAGLTCAARSRAAGAQAQATTCTSNSDCPSSFCVDGYCCDTACTGQCEACNVEGAEGTCTPVSGQPVGDRPACSGSDPCTAACDGQTTTSCTAYPGLDVVCADPVCEAGWLTMYGCGGDGTCHPTTTACDPLGCNAAGTACADGCATHDDCPETSHCAEGTCVENKGLGEPCTDGVECQFGYCATGVCCNEACAGACQACGSDGFCAAALNDETCAGGTCCDGECVDTASDVAHCGACDAACAGAVCQVAVCAAGVCGTEPAPDGTPCDEGRVCLDGECGCAEGLTLCGETCVDTQTDLQHCGDCAMDCPEAEECQRPACAEGQCTTAPDPEQAGDVCADDTCVDGVLTTSACDADGNCAPSTTDCGLYLCNTDGTACLTHCQNNEDCLDEECCLDTCCASGQECCGSTCCASGQCCIETCCADGQVCGEGGGCVAACGEGTEPCGAECCPADLCCDGTCCPEGQPCVDGACGCPAGLTVCDGSCVDTSADPNHCGDCNVACTEAEECRIPVCADSLCTSVPDPDAVGEACGDGAVCADGELTTSACGAEGNCAETVTDCGLYLCNTEGTACLTACQNHDECLGAAFCNEQGECRGDKAENEPCTSPDECASGRCLFDVCAAGCSEDFPLQCGEDCCADYVTCCAGECCDPGQTCCGDADVCCDEGLCCAGACCAEGTVCCGDTCCATGEECCGDTCCSYTCCGGDTCCGPGQSCFTQSGECGCSSDMEACGDTCCIEGDVCCDGACCGPTQICEDNQCACAPDREACGDTCCPPATTCDEDTGECLCPPVVEGAVPLPPCGDECCDGFQTCCDGVVCCDSIGEICTNGICCSPVFPPDPPLINCNGACCAEEQCCNAGDDALCCAPGEICCGGFYCCAPDQCSGGACCPPGQQNCDNECRENCCPGNQRMCEYQFGRERCCRENEVCVDDACVCPEEQSCDLICCPSGTKCCAGSCFVVECCGFECDGPDGPFCCDTPCLDAISANDVCCDPGVPCRYQGPYVDPVQKCCPPGETCVFDRTGGCCPAGRECCGDTICDEGLLCCGDTCADECCEDGRPRCQGVFGSHCCDEGEVCLQEPGGKCCPEGSTGLCPTFNPIDWFTEEEGWAQCCEEGTSCFCSGGRTPDCRCQPI